MALYEYVTIDEPKRNPTLIAYSRDAVTDLLTDILSEIDKLQTYKMFSGDTDILINRDDVKNIIKSKFTLPSEISGETL